MNAYKKVALSAAVSFLLSSCSSQGTIAGLEDDSPELEAASLDFSNLNHEKVRTEYEELLDLVDDSYLKEQIQRRIAGVQMQEGDVKSATKAPRKGYYRQAIAGYIDILEKYPNSPDNAEVLYQLAKAYDMEGETNNAQQMLERLVRLHPYYPLMAEVQFRLGDIYFSKQQYGRAEKAYRETTEQDGGKLILNAHYMLAWSQYKQGRYGKALDHLAFVLDELLVAEMAGRALTKTEQHLVKDTLHSMSLALVNLGGAQAIEDVRGLESKQYVWRVYEQLAGFYLEKARYDDSAVTYREYIMKKPLDGKAAHFHENLIAAYVKGAFPKLVLSEKENYVDFYGPQSRYLDQHEGQRAGIYKKLNVYYKELAEHYHAQAQKASKEAKATKQSHLTELAATSYAKATDYYGRFIVLFTNDKQLADLTYKKADAHFESAQYEQAALNYEKVGYELKAKTKLANKAAYASIVSLTKHIDHLTASKASKEEMDKWHAKSVESMLRFAKVFHKDTRAIAVLTNATQSMFALGQYDRAIQVARDLVDNNKKLSANLKKTAYGILAHAYFQKGEYQLAQDHYTLQRKLVAKTSPDYSEISDQIAASIIKKADGIRALGQKSQAIKTLLSIKVVSPQSKYRVPAQFDAVSLMLEDKQWKKAIAELKQMQRQFPKHALAVEFPRKLAFAYEQSKQWKLAAAAYTKLFKQDKDPKVKQDALFVAAGLEKKLGRFDTAIELYRDYAHKYEQPFDNRMEARYNLADLYDRKNDKTRHLFWLRRIIDGDKKGGDQRTERSRYLGAWANTKYGDYFAWEFKRRSLRDPLNSSLAKKNQYLQDAATRYEMASEYGMLEFVSQSSYKLADLYEGFSAELLSAPLKGLSEQDAQAVRQILRQQADSFSNLALGIYQNNIELSWQGHFNEWISKSFDAMKRLSPERFGKVEEVARYGDEIR